MHAPRPPVTRLGPLAVVVALTFVLATCSAEPSPTPTATPTPTAGPTSSPAATPVPGDTSSPTMSACDPTQLSARVIEWQGGAGHRMASVEMTNPGPSACVVGALAQPQLVDGSATVLIDGVPASMSPLVTVPAGGTLRTTVDAANYCGPDPAAPVTVAFLFPGGLGRLVSAPASPTDTSGVPPCSGPSEAATIEMQPWAP